MPHPLSFVIFESTGMDYMPPRLLAKFAARNYPATVVNQPVRWSAFRKLSFESRIERIGKRLTEYRNYDLPRRSFLARFTDVFNANRMRKELDKIEGAGLTRVTVFDRPAQFRKVKRLGESMSAYYAHCDNTVDILGRGNPLVRRDEIELLQKVDIAFAASQPLVDRFQEYCKRVVHLPCGFDSEIFDPTIDVPTPEKLNEIEGPRILFSGYISGRVDFEGLLATVRESPELQFVFVGLISEEIHAELVTSNRAGTLADELFSEENVHYLGRVQPHEVPAIVKACDVGMVPYCMSEFTATSSPIKTFEYLAMGKPVVATPILESTRLTSELHLVEERQSYRPAILKALQLAGDKDSISERLAAVSNESMQARAETMINSVKALLH